MITNDFISPINQKKEYFQISGNLTNSMHLFFLYDDNDKESLEFWSDFLKNLIEKFQKHLKISTISNDINTHKDLMQLYTDGDIKDIKYPSIILTHAHLYDPQIVIGITPIDLYSLIEQFVLLLQLSIHILILKLNFVLYLYQYTDLFFHPNFL